MKRILPIASILLVVAAFSAVAAGQDKPSFAGTWKLAGPAQAEMFTPSQLVVGQDATELTVTATSQAQLDDPRRKDAGVE